MSPIRKFALMKYATKNAKQMAEMIVNMNLNL
jgi:hypothetical protein